MLKRRNLTIEQDCPLVESNKLVIGYNILIINRVMS